MNVISPDQIEQRAQLNSVVNYYDKTWFDYRALWLNDVNHAIHFGYDDGQRRSHSDSLLLTNQVMADSAAVQPGDRILDAGCGVGGSGMWLAETKGVNVVGITPVRRQVERARRKIAARGLTHKISVELGDYTATNFPDASFDIVWALESVCHSVAKAAFYRESSRLLRPGGRLVVAEYMRARRPLSNHEDELLQRWLRGWMIPDLDTVAEHISHSHNAGLQQVEARDITPQMRRSLRRLYILSLFGVPISSLLRKWRLRGEISHGNVLGSRFQYQALRRGSWIYTLLVARKPHAERDTPGRPASSGPGGA